MRNNPAINLWIAGDLHFLHDNLIKEEYCSRPADHSNKIFKNLMTIPENDLLICLGDISIGRELEVYEKFIKPLKYRKILVKGNHDRKTNNWYLTHGWDFVCYSFQDTYRGKRVLFSHYPVCADGYDFNFCGHLHNNIYKFENLTKENQVFVNEKHVLFALELTNYRPLKLDYMIDKVDKFRLINTFGNKKCKNIIREK